MRKVPPQRVAPASWPAVARTSRSALVVAALLILACAAFPAQSPGAPPPNLRYHFGDNPAWANPIFDDSAWPVAENAHVPAPPSNSNGFLWIRGRISVPAGLNGPLAVQTSVDAAHVGVPIGVVEIYVNGTAAGQLGEFPPQDSPQIIPRSVTFPLHPVLAPPGQTVTVAVREWTPPALLVGAAARDIAISIDRATVLATAARADNADALLASQPMLVPNLLLILLGLALLALWPAVRSRELLLNAVWLITLPLYVGMTVITQAGLVSSSFLFWLIFFFFLRIPGFWVTVELIWTVHRIRSSVSRVLAHACWIAYLVIELIANLPNQPAAWIPPFLHASYGALVLFNVLCLGANLWALFIARRNRIIAAAFTLVNIPLLVRVAGIPINITIGTVTIDGQIVGFFIAGVAITAMLVRQAIAAWDAGRKLRVEFDAAREVQQRLVPLALPAVPGCTLAAAYMPAAEVGGDFYQVLPQPAGTALIVVGDVSGKGLKAAMTGTMVLGALRSLAQETNSPGKILDRLNAQLAATSDGGFVTCLCARIAADGAAYARQRRPSRALPQRRRSSRSIPACLSALRRTPLTLNPPSTSAPGDRLTFLSDGVVEAQTPTGELFGFDRTQAISTQSAEAIARAAQAHGQEDDITVLSPHLRPV